jgi:hypothetical protein
VDTATTNAVPGLTPARVRKYAAQGLLDKHGKAYMIHDWVKYAPKDQTAADRMAKWRATRTQPVTETVTTTVTEAPETTTETVTPTVTAPSRVPVSRSSPNTLSPTNVGEPHADNAQLRALLDKIGCDTYDMQRALTDPDRAIAAARYTLAEPGLRNPVAYYRKLWASGVWAEASAPAFLPLSTILAAWIRNAGYHCAWTEVLEEIERKQRDRGDKLSDDELAGLHAVWSERHPAEVSA